MAPQYLAASPCQGVQNAAFRPQHISLGRYLYIFTSESGILCLGYLWVTLITIVGQAGPDGPVPTKRKNWRKTCRTASKLCWLSVWLRSLQPVLIPHRSKNTSWLIPRQFRKSRPTKVNTSNSALMGWRAALWPANHRSLQPREDAVC